MTTLWIAFAISAIVSASGWFIAFGPIFRYAHDAVSPVLIISYGAGIIGAIVAVICLLGIAFVYAMERV